MAPVRSCGQGKVKITFLEKLYLLIHGEVRVRQKHHASSLSTLEEYFIPLHVQVRKLENGEIV